MENIKMQITKFDTTESENNNKVIPAIITNQIGTSDNKLFRLTTPMDTYLNAINAIGNTEPQEVPYSRFSAIRDMFNYKVRAGVKQAIITAFNMTNNPIGYADTTLATVNGASIYDNAETGTFTMCPSRQPIELFTRRETLDDLLCCTGYINFEISENVTKQYMVEYAIFLISKLYDRSMSFIDCEKDVVNFNRFINNLSATLPSIMVNYYDELQIIINNYKLETRNNCEECYPF